MGVDSTLEGIPLSPAIAVDGWLSVPSGVTKKYVEAELVNKQALERVDRKRSDHQRRTPATSQTGSANRSDRSDAENAAKLKTASSGGTPSELADLVLS